MRIAFLRFLKICFCESCFAAAVVELKTSLSISRQKCWTRVFACVCFQFFMFLYAFYRPSFRFCKPSQSCWVEYREILEKQLIRLLRMASIAANCSLFRGRNQIAFKSSLFLRLNYELLLLEKGGQCRNDVYVHPWTLLISLSSFCSLSPTFITIE